MGDLVVNNDHDPAFILLQTYNDRFMETGDVYDAYRHARDSHPLEFQAVNERALDYGHQQGVVGDTYHYRLQMILKGHHRSPQCGVSIGCDGFVACLTVKYKSHNFAANPFIDAFINSNVPLRLYARLPDPVTEGLEEIDLPCPDPEGLEEPDLPGPDGNGIFLGGLGLVPGIFLGGPAPVGEQGNAEVPGLLEIWHEQHEGDQVAVVVDDSSKKTFLAWKIHKRKRSEKVYYDFP
ncbi:hypothetical protein POM88_000079 [Heracleum sosnowskyi]|uniref:Uncharacterized protein n=1 Tax=Heracleum sosnowskyi TaxID=360622 RepID=A0AAD8N8D6_9APIA|nr:hypothetical protein POM88_000079 [Heracleum sosnowskyi]